MYTVDITLEKVESNLKEETHLRQNIEKKTFNVKIFYFLFRSMNFSLINSICLKKALKIYPRP